MAGERVGWVGLGAIGLPMAARVAEAGFAVAAWDPVEERRQAAAALGIEVAADVALGGAVAGAAAGGAAADAPRSSRATQPIVVCVVRDADQVADSLLGPGGALAGGGRIGVVMSSIGAEAMVKLAARAAEEGATLLDAPILGNPASAEAGELLVPLAGPAAAKAAVTPLLRSFASSVVGLGAEPGAAQAVKAVSQQLQILGMVAAVEALELARARGVGEAQMLEILGATEPTWATRNWDYAKGLWRGGDETTSLGLFAKDLAAALEDASAAGVEMPLASRGLALLDRRLAEGPLGDREAP